MAKIEFIGRIFPAGTHISINNAPRIRLPIRNLSFSADVTTNVIDSNVRIICDIPVSFRPKYLINLYVDTTTLVQGIVNLVAFHLGAGAIVCIDHWLDPSGNKSEISLSDPNLPQYCTAFNGSVNFRQVIELLVAEPALHMILNDLVLAQVFPNHALINSARAIEGIRHLIAGLGTEPKKAWPIMCNALNIERSYIQLITDHSTKPRHGNIVTLDGVTMLLITERSWVITDRFLHYLLRKKQKLSGTQFPLLRN